MCRTLILQIFGVLLFLIHVELSVGYRMYYAGMRVVKLYELYVIVLYLSIHINIIPRCVMVLN
jgi:hypothetical protein